MSFVKRGILLGSGALILFIVLALATYPYERAIDRALSRISEKSIIAVTAGQTSFLFPNRVTFHDLRLLPKEQPYHLLETTLTKLSAQIGLRGLLTRKLRIRFTGDVDSGDTTEGVYGVNGTVCLRRGEAAEASSPIENSVLEVYNVRLTGSGVNLTVDGHVTLRGNVLNPVVELRFGVEKLERTDSANYAISNLLKFVEGTAPSESRPPLAFEVSGPLSELTVRQEIRESSTEG